MEESRQVDTHIVPIGREFDRAVLPFLANRSRPPPLRADRIHLVVPDSPASKRLALRVERALRSTAAVEAHAIVQDGGGRRRVIGIEPLLETFSNLVHRELEERHRVHINLSSGTKLLALAAGLAGMAQLRPGLGTLYHVLPAEYSFTSLEIEEHGLTKGLIEVQEIALLPLLMPPPVQRRVLAFAKRANEPDVAYRDLLQFLCEIPDSGFEGGAVASAQRSRRWNNAATTRMVRTILGPMSQDRLIEIRDLGRRKAIRLTPRGRLYAALSAIRRPELKRRLVRPMSTPSQGHA